MKLSSTQAMLIMSYLSVFTRAAPTPEIDTDVACDPAGAIYTGFICDLDKREEIETKREEIETEPVCDPAGDIYTGFHCENPPNPEDIPATGVEAREADAEAQSIYQIIEGCDDPATDTNCD